MKYPSAWIFVLLMATLAWSQNDLPTRTQICRKTDEAITIDGKLDEKVWDELDSLVMTDIITGADPKFAVFGKIAWDDDFFYAGYDIKDTSIWAQCSIRDFKMFKKGGYDESFVKLFIDVGADARKYIEIHVNPLNNIRDVVQSHALSKFTRKTKYGYREFPKKDTLWNCPGLRTAVAIKGSLNDPSDVDEGWTVEIAVPFSAIAPLCSIAPPCGGIRNCPPQTGDVWNIFLCRRYVENVGAMASYWGWPSLGEVSTHRVDRWCHVVFADKNGALATKTGASPEGTLSWRALRAQAPATEAKAKAIVDFAGSMNFNTVIIPAARPGGICNYNSSFLKKPADIGIDPLQCVIREAKESGIAVYAQLPCLTVPSADYFDAHPEHEQMILPEEMPLVGQPRVKPDRDNIQEGRWLSPGQGLVTYVKQILEEIAQTGVDGIVLDQVGYRNYHGCYNDYSVVKSQEYQDWFKDYGTGGDFSYNPMIREEYSEQCLVDWTTQAVQAIQNKKEGLKVICRMSLDFDPNPFWMNRLSVDYCRMISPPTAPFGSDDKIALHAATHVGLESAFHCGNKGVQMVNAGTKASPKTLERLRAEMKIALSFANAGLIVGPYDVLAEESALANMVSEEIKAETRRDWPGDRAAANPRRIVLVCSSLPRRGHVIRWHLPGQSRVSLSAYSVLGENAGTICGGIREAGAHRILWHNDHLGKGVYFVNLSVTGTQTHRVTKKLVVF